MDLRARKILMKYITFKFSWAPKSGSYTFCYIERKLVTQGELLVKISPYCRSGTALVKIYWTKSFVWIKKFQRFKKIHDIKSKNNKLIPKDFLDCNVCSTNNYR